MLCSCVNISSLSVGDGENSGFSLESFVVVYHLRSLDYLKLWCRGHAEMKKGVTSQSGGVSEHRNWPIPKAKHNHRDHTDRIKQMHREHSKLMMTVMAILLVIASVWLPAEAKAVDIQAGVAGKMAGSAVFTDNESLDPPRRLRRRRAGLCSGAFYPLPRGGVEL